MSELCHRFSEPMLMAWLACSFIDLDITAATDDFTQNSLRNTRTARRGQAMHSIINGQFLLFFSFQPVRSKGLFLGYDFELLKNN